MVHMAIDQFEMRAFYFGHVEYLNEQIKQTGNENYKRGYYDSKEKLMKVN